MALYLKTIQMLSRITCIIVAILCILPLAPAHSQFLPDNLLNSGLLAMTPNMVQVTNAQSEKITNGAKQFVENMGEEGLAFLGSGSMSKSEKQAKFKQLINQNFDMVTIARFALGRYWRTATDKERKEYVSRFKSMIISVYSKRFGEYSGEKLLINSAYMDNPKDTIVSSSIVPAKGQKISVDWRVRYKNDGYKVVDVIVEGVSMSVTQRSEFSSIIQRGGGNVSVLIDHLKSAQ